MNTKRIGSVGAQPGDPAWARLLLTVLEGHEGQCRRAIVFLTPLLLLVVLPVAGLVLLLMLIAPTDGWIGGVLGGGSLIASSLALYRGRGKPPPR